jgi:hypothetical protein
MVAPVRKEVECKGRCEKRKKVRSGTLKAVDRCGEA